MFDELRKSISASLYERVASPLYGTFIFSWLFWNWRIAYLTIFVGADQLKGKTKLEYIEEKFLSDCNVLFWYPILSTIALICVIPFIANGAFWLSEWFKNWRKKQKLKLSGETPIPQSKYLEVSLAFKEEEKKYAIILAEKSTSDALNEDLQRQLTGLSQQKSDSDRVLIERTKEWEELREQNKRLLAETDKAKVKNLGDLFKGIWHNNHEYNNGQKGSEDFEIKNGNEYYISGRLVFKIDMLDYDPINNSVKFRKVGNGDNSKAINELKKVNNDLYSGIEYSNPDNVITIRYSRRLPKVKIISNNSQ